MRRVSERGLAAPLRATLNGVDLVAPVWHVPIFELLLDDDLDLVPLVDPRLRPYFVVAAWVQMTDLFAEEPLLGVRLGGQRSCRGITGRVAGDGALDAGTEAEGNGGTATAHIIPNGPSTAEFDRGLLEVRHGSLDAGAEAEGRV